MNSTVFRAASVFLLALLAGCGDQSKSSASPTAPKRVDDGSADVAKGLEALEQQDPTAAVAAFTTASLKCETNFEAHVHLAMVRNRLGDVNGAAEAAAKALELCPDSAEARLVDGQAAYLKKDYRRALEDFTAVTSEKSLPAAIRSEAWSARGVVEMAQGIHDSARISFLRASLLNYNNASAWYHLGVLSRDVYLIPESALEQFQVACGLLDARRDPRAKKISRDILPSVRKMINAANLASKADLSKRDPAAAMKLLADAKSMRSRKMVTMATKKIEEAFAADPLSGPVALEYARIKTIRAKTPADVDKILDAYGVAINHDSASQAIYLEAAQLAYKHGRWSTTVAIMDRAVAHDPQNRQTIDLLIAALQKAGKSKQAEAWKSFRADLR